MASADWVARRFIGRPFFYGWLIVLITFTTAMTTAGISGYGLSFFIVPMSEELGISRTQFSAIAVFRLALLPLLPFLGLLVDRKHGPRLLVTIGSIIAGLVLMSTSLVQELWQFYLMYGVIFGLAMFSMGGQLVGPAVISKWFIRKRGRAMAIGTMGISTGGFIIAPMAGWFVGEFGWRTAWVLLGIFMIVAITPMAALFMRRQPEDIGLLPDGDTPGGGRGRPRPGLASTEYPWTVREAFRTRALWIMMGVQSLGSMGLMPVIFHQVAYIQDKSFSLATATAVAATLAFFAIVAKPIWGFTGGAHIHVRWVIPMCVIPAGVSLFCSDCRPGLDHALRLRRIPRPYHGGMAHHCKPGLGLILRSAAPGSHSGLCDTYRQHGRSSQPRPGRLCVGPVRQLRPRIRRLRDGVDNGRYSDALGRAPSTACQGRSRRAASGLRHCLDAGGIPFAP